MKNSSDPVRAVPDKAAASVDDLVHSAADAIGPLAEAAAEAISHAADRVSPFAHAVADKVGPAVQSAADQVGPLAHTAADRIGPLVHSAGERVAPLTSQAVDRVSPIAHQAVDRVSPIAHQAVDRVTPYAQQAVDAVAPYAALAKERGLQAGHDAADRFGPAVGAARDKVSDDLLPKVSAALTTAASAPVVVSAVDRGRAALGIEAPVPVVPAKKSHKLRTVAIVAAGAAAAYVLVRKLLGDKGSEWQTARPSAPYVPPAATPAAAAPTGPIDEVVPDQDLAGPQTPDTVEQYGQPMGDLAADDTDATAEEDVNALIENEADADEEVPPVPGTQGTDGPPTATAASGSSGEDAAPDDPGSTDAEPSHDEPAAASGDSFHSDEPVDEELGSTEEHDTAVGGEAPVSTEDDNAAGVGPDAHPGRWAEHGAYVGVEPPEGFFVKANERSMKYHLPESGGYGRTISEIWFSSEEAAQAAGFVRAQR